MRENIANQSPMDTLSFNGFQTPYANVSAGQKDVLINISSNVYYGYQPLRAENSSGFMHTETLNKPSIEMDTTQCESRLTNRKRTRDSSESSLDVSKKRRQNEQTTNSPHNTPRQSPTKALLEEELLRETHGCSYYHWVSSL